MWPMPHCRVFRRLFVSIPAAQRPLPKGVHVTCNSKSGSLCKKKYYIIGDVRRICSPNGATVNPECGSKLVPLRLDPRSSCPISLMLVKNEDIPSLQCVPDRLDLLIEDVLEVWFPRFEARVGIKENDTTLIRKIL